MKTKQGALKMGAKSASVLFAIFTTGTLVGQVNYTPYTFTTISGLASSGFRDGTNSDSRFANPCNIVADAATNLYVADAYNNAIRMVSPSGTNWVVTTIAGTGIPGTNDGFGSVAQFNHPQGIALDTNGYVYIADSYNSTIRKIVPSGSNWVVSTIATSVPDPVGLVFDGSGNIYVAEQTRNCIALMVPSGSNWVVSTFAGFSGPGGPGGSGTNDGTGANARFNQPSGITIASNGNLFVADSGNTAVRMITPSAVVTTPIGTAGVGGSADGTNKAASFSASFGIVSDSSGNLYLPDTYNDTIRKITPVGTNWVVTTIAGAVRAGGSQDGTNNSALFYWPYGIAVDRSGNFYVTDSINNTIRKLSPNGTNWSATTIAGLPGSTGTNDGSPSAARFCLTPSIPNDGGGVALDSSGNIYVSDCDNHTIRMITVDGMSHTIAGTAHVKGSADGTNGVASFFYPNGIAVDSATNVYVVDQGNSLIRRISPEGTNWVVTTLAGTSGVHSAHDGTNNGAGFARPTTIAIDAATNLYVADTLAKIRKISALGTNWVVTTPSISVASFFNPYGVALDVQGNIYASDQFTGSLYRFAPSGTNWITTLVAGPGVSSQSSDIDGTNTAVRFSSLCGITIDSKGNLYIADVYNSTIRRATPSGTNWVVSTLGGVGNPPPYLFGEAGSADGVGAAARFFEPNAVAVDASGNIYVADTYNNTIRKGVPPTTIILGKPTFSANQVQFGFNLAFGSAASFHLLQASQPTGPWTTNYSAIIVSNVPGVSYTVTVPAAGNSAFYCIQTP